MAEMIASTATGVMAPVLGKLAALLGEKYQLSRDVEHGIRFLKDELSTIDAVLHRLADKDDDQIDPLTKDLKNKVRELSYDIEDCIDRFVLNHSHGGSKANFVRKAMRKVKTLLKDVGIAKEIQQLKNLVGEQSERAKRYYYDINQCLLVSPQPVLLDPRVTVLFQEAKDLVGTDAPCQEIIQLLKCEEKQHKVVSIYGIGGQGKTTLAMEAYKITKAAFDCWAFVSVSQTPDMKKLLRDILSQISPRNFHQSQMLETVEQLIRTVRECLKDKRYLILIDDIWSVSAWELIRSALPINDNGSRIITTTRIKAVANSCCTGIAPQMYEAKPLSDEDSQRLFFKRLFSSRDDCHPDLRKVADDILKKCCGLPLAIISIAGLLANRSKTLEVWGNVLRSISAAVDKDSPIDKMKRILLLSYFDLPHHLKNCLLYLSVFPEDYLIDCRRLILLWVAEGLIPGQDRVSMEQLGRSYLNELINRSLVQPTNVGEDGTTVKHCKVHDVILEFIVSKAVEDNFVTIWNGNDFSENYSSYKIRRLSIQKDFSAEVIAMTIKNAAHVRSVNIFGSNSVLVKKYASAFLKNQVLRVLNTGGEVGGLVKSFGQLKYLRAYGPKLLEDTYRLQHLETLDLRSSNVRNLPKCIIHLQKLVRLFISMSERLPDAIKNLQALEELSRIDLDNQSLEFIQGLGDMTNLKVVEIRWRGFFETLLSKLFMRLQELRLLGANPDGARLLMASCVRTPPPPLQKLFGLGTRDLNTIGPQISSLVNLTSLSIEVYGEAGKKGINILASLPMLLLLTVGLFSCDAISCTRHAISRQGFQRLVLFSFNSWREDTLEFESGAMPKLERLNLHLMARYQFKIGEGGFILGLQNLTNLKNVVVDVDCNGAFADEVEAMEDDIRATADALPNRSMLDIRRAHKKEVRRRRPPTI